MNAYAAATGDCDGNISGAASALIYSAIYCAVNPSERDEINRAAYANQPLVGYDATLDAAGDA